jgi:putative NADH-flavin reductase
MKVAIIGISGRAGSRIAAETVKRGHTVTGIARNASNIQAPAGVTVREADANNITALADVIRGHDAVISAAKFTTLKAKPLLDAVKAAGVKRLIVVGGTASLEVAPGKIVLDLPDFPQAYKSEAAQGVAFLKDLRAEHDVDWTFISPAAEFAPGERTGKFRIGGDQLLTDANGKSAISMEDYAIALVDELEQPKHVKQRFTVAY